MLVHIKERRIEKMAFNPCTSAFNQIMALKCFGSLYANRLPDELKEAYINLLQVAAKHATASVDEIVAERIKLLESQD